MPESSGTVQASSAWACQSLIMRALMWPCLMRAAALGRSLGGSALRNGSESFVHAYSGHGVIENALTAPWARRVVARFAFPERL